MWTKEDLQGKYIKITSQQDYDTVIKVLEELDIQQDKEYLGEKYENRFNTVFVATKYGYFLSESKYSDIPIQQFYDYLSFKTLKVEDLVEGEIYCSIFKKNPEWESIHLCTKNPDLFTYRLYINKGTNNRFDNTKWGSTTENNYRIATPEEKKWLNVCIKQDKFIPKEDLHLYDDVTFELKSLQTIPEYGECIKNDLSNFTKGKIYKLENNSCVDNFGRIIHSIREDWFKPSTKEAFEAQNKPQFEVGKWAEIVSLPKSKTIDLTNTKIRVDSPELSKLVQEKAFELGWKWCSGGKTIQLTNSKFLFFSESFISKSDEDEKYFIQHSSKEILPSDLGINLNITKIIPKSEIKFDYDTYLFKEGFTKHPLTSNEAFQQEGLIDTTINKIQSVSVELYQPEELQLF